MNNEAGLLAFLTGRKIFVFDPDTRASVAEVVYGPKGRVWMRHVDGWEDLGRWGVDGSEYWTRYENFRDGSENRFYLEPVTADTAQAYFADGRRAFLQSHQSTLDHVEV